MCLVSRSRVPLFAPRQAYAASVDLAVRAQQGADRRGGVGLTATAGVVARLSGGRSAGQTGAMRAICIVLAVIGGCALVAAVVIELATGNAAGVGWVLAGPTPFYVAGLVGAFRGPGHRVAVWLLAAGATF